MCTNVAILFPYTTATFYELCSMSLNMLRDQFLSLTEGAETSQAGQFKKRTVS